MGNFSIWLYTGVKYLEPNNNNINNNIYLKI
jgi:hypothetical protein